MNVVLKGITKEILNNMIKQGYANTKSEAIRLAILSFGEGHFIETLQVNKKLDYLDSEINNGKRKLHDANTALGEHVKHLK